MHQTLKTILKDWKILLLLAVLLLSIIAISPRIGTEGLAIRSVAKDSAAYLAGIESPGPSVKPVQREQLISINGQQVKTLEEYKTISEALEPNTTVLVKTNKKVYTLTTRWKTETTTLNETEEIITEELVNETINNVTTQTLKNITTTRNKTITTTLGLEPIGLTLTPRAGTNIKKGLDLQGGTRIILQPAETVPAEDLDYLVTSMSQRLNVYGLSDLTIRSSQDLPPSLGGTGKQFIIVEIAGATQDDVQKIVSSQGKFEAKIGNTTVFKGGNDITYVCRTSTCSGIDPNKGCSFDQFTQQYYCPFFFTISLSQEAAERQARATQNLNILPPSQDGGERYLERPLDLYLDDENVSSLQISSELKGRKVTDISITGIGTGTTRTQAQQSAIDEMKQLQTILITGSLPVRLTIVKTDTISPALGSDFLKNALIAGFSAIIAVGVLITLRYRTLKISLPILFTMLSEITIILGFAVFVGWEIDLAAIAGIIIAIGTGVDHQIVIADETLNGRKQHYTSMKQSIKNAFTIIFTSALTTGVALLPLLFAGAGLLKGFALTSIAGIVSGVLIARPAYAALLQYLQGENV